MQELTKNDYRNQIITSYRNEFISNASFEEYDVSAPFYSTLKFYFVDRSSRLENIRDQKVDEESTYSFFQVPYNKRGEGIKPTSLTIYTTITDNTLLQDDGRGNIFNNLNQKVGNIFYNSGIILLYHSSIIGETTQFNVEYLRVVKFTKESYNIFFNSREIINSCNETFIKNKHDNEDMLPYITSIVLYNDDNEPIKRARLSKPIRCKEDIMFVLEHFG